MLLPPSQPFIHVSIIYNIYTAWSKGKLTWRCPEICTYQVWLVWQRLRSTRNNAVLPRRLREPARSTPRWGYLRINKKNHVYIINSRINFYKHVQKNSSSHEGLADVIQIIILIRTQRYKHVHKNWSGHEGLADVIHIIIIILISTQRYKL